MDERVGGGRASWPWQARPAIAIAVALCLGVAARPASALDKTEKVGPALASAPLPIPQGHVETVSFAAPRHAPVKVVRGVGGPLGHPATGRRVEIVSFGQGGGRRVTVVRGIAPVAGSGGAPPPQQANGGGGFAGPPKTAGLVGRGAPLWGAGRVTVWPGRGGG